MSGVADAIGKAAVGDGVADDWDAAEGMAVGTLLGATVADAPEQPTTTSAMSKKRRIEVLP